MIYQIFFLFLCYSKFLSHSHFSSVLSSSNETNNSELITFSLFYDEISALYLTKIKLQETDETAAEDFAVSLNSTTPFFCFQEKNVSLNSTNSIPYNISILFNENVTLYNQTVLVGTESESAEEIILSPTLFSGVFGLGLLPAPNNDSNQTNTSFLTMEIILNELVERNLIKDNIFSIYLGSIPAKDNSTKLYLGGINSSLVQNNFIYTIKTEDHQWGFNLLALELMWFDEDTYAGKVFSNLTARIDISTPNILLPLELIIEFTIICENLYKTCTLDQNSNSLFCIDKYPFLSKDFPYVTFFFNESLFINIDPLKLLYDCGKTDSYLEYCRVKLGLSNENETIILGQNFLETTYVIYDLTNKTIGVAFEQYYFVTSSSFILDYTFYVLLTIWGLTMVACGVYFKGYLLKLNIMTNKITKIFYDKIKSLIRGRQNNVDLDDSDSESEEIQPAAVNNLNNVNNGIGIN